MPWTQTEMAGFEQRVAEANSHFERFRKSSLHTLIALLKTNPLPSADAIRQALAAIPANKADTKYNSAMTYLRVNYPGMDEKTIGGYTYKGFLGIADETQRLNRATLAVSRCYEIVANCQKAMARVMAQTATSKSPALWSEDQRKVTELFQKWFDDKRKVESVNRVTQVFNNMAESLRADLWEIVVYGTPEDPDPRGLGSTIANAFAFVVPSENAYRIYLGALFWREGDSRIDIPTVSHAIAAPTRDAWQDEKKTKIAMDAAIVTTIHELCHVQAISGATAITDVAPNPYDLATCKDRAKNNPNLALTNAENYAQFASALLMQKHFF